MAKKDIKKDVAKVLSKALKLMNNKGAHWVKGSYKTTVEDGTWGYCSVGAIEAVIESDYEHSEEMREAALKAVAYRLPNASSGDHDRIVEWNDDGNRTWDDVVTRFNAAIERQKA